MKSDRTKILLLIILTVAAGALINTEAFCDPVLSIEPDTSEVDVSTEFVVSFHAGGEVTDLMGYNVTFSYDPSYLNLVSVD
ncbi:MAG: hypothetical protein GF417_10670, partial [Candidatus Latescibacteria bacterium]|nr:hypothetical protein [bacterium]MBD3424890.1 hypothetical protein [Candidatus Latescibacterota bacterium]